MLSKPTGSPSSQAAPGQNRTTRARKGSGNCSACAHSSPRTLEHRPATLVEDELLGEADAPGGVPVIPDYLLNGCLNALGKRHNRPAPRAKRWDGSNPSVVENLRKAARRVESPNVLGDVVPLICPPSEMDQVVADIGEVIGSKRVRAWHPLTIDVGATCSQIATSGVGELALSQSAGPRRTLVASSMLRGNHLVASEHS